MKILMDPYQIYTTFVNHHPLKMKIKKLMIMILNRNVISIIGGGMIVVRIQVVVYMVVGGDIICLR
jgi:hypothetical protein